MLPAGPTPPNPLELLNRLNFDEFMIQAKGAFDVVIVDTPAMTSGEDAAMIAVRTGAALAVARSRLDPGRRLHRPRAGADGRRRRRRRLGAQRGAAQEEKEEGEVSSVLPARRRAVSRRAAAELPWWIALAGFAAMYLPLYWWAANGIWQTDEHGHGALILLVLLWLFWGLRQPIAAAPTRPAPAWGWSLFAFGLLLYIVGRVVGISIFDVRLAAVRRRRRAAAAEGPAALRVAWFPLFYFVFMIPLPGMLVDAITGPLKQWISVIVVELLYPVGYPIARTGVVLTIGQYQMLVADACSGLHSMYSLSALGTLFMYIMARPEQAAQRDHAGQHPADRVRRQHRARDRAGADHVSLRRRGRAGLPARRRRHGADAGGAGVLLRPRRVARARCSPGATRRGRRPLRQVHPTRADARARPQAGAAGARRPLSWRRVSAGTAAIMSAANCCCIAKARAGSLSIDEMRNSRPSGIWPVRPRRNSTIRLSKLVADHLVADRQPVGDGLVARAQARRQAAHVDVAERGRQRAVLEAVDLEALRRIADLGPVRLQPAALVVAVGHATA